MLSSNMKFLICYPVVILRLTVFNLAYSDRIQKHEIQVHDDLFQHIKDTNSSLERTIIRARTVPDRVSNECNIAVQKRSAYIFQQILKKHRPHFVQFRIKLYNIKINKTSDVFQPGRWYWTFGLMSKPYQFLTWDLHYGIFTFGLLDFKTAFVPMVFMNVTGKCNLTLGTKGTSELITKALIPLINVDSASHLLRQYKENYFCYLFVDEDIRNTFAYTASIYLLYPTIYINYKCCYLKYNFTSSNYTDYCSKEITKVQHWPNVITFNIILGIMIIAFCPLPLFRLFAWLGEGDVTEQRLEVINDLLANEVYEQEEWVFANGKHPLTFFDVMSFRGIGLDENWPVLVSRLRRFIFLILAPSIIYIELLMNSHGIGVWKENDKITIKDFVDVGTPVGIISLLGDSSNRYKVFVPALGGPVVISSLYFVLGFFYLVCPKSLRSVVDNGLPNADGCRLSLSSDDRGQYCKYRFIKSPLFYGLSDIIKLSQIDIESSDLQLGYSKCATIMKCNFYMLFTMKFWYQVWCIQKSRLCVFRAGMPLLLCLLCVLFIPIYIVFCLLEIVLCILYFGVPFLFFLVVMVRAAMSMIPDLKTKYQIFSYVFRIRFIMFLCNTVLLIPILLFSYCIYLLIVSSFTFVAQIITYCFVAVIIFPSVSFGNLFLLLVIVYYIIRQLQLFSYNYTSLLLSAVAISKRISETHNNVACFNGHLVISNVVLEDLSGIEINGRLLDTCQIQDSLINNDAEKLLEMKMENNCYGIPKELYQILIHKYYPIHKHVLSLLFRVSGLTFCVLLFLSITHSYHLVPDDQIAEVLHVIFIIAVGALPKLIESNLVSHYNAPKVKIENKFIAQTVIEYWTRRQNL